LHFGTYCARIPLHRLHLGRQTSISAKPSSESASSKGDLIETAKKRTAKVSKWTKHTQAYYEGPQWYREFRTKKYYYTRKYFRYRCKLQGLKSIFQLPYMSL